MNRFYWNWYFPYLRVNLLTERILMTLNYYQVLTIPKEEQTSGINKEVLTSFNKRHKIKFYIDGSLGKDICSFIKLFLFSTALLSLSTFIRFPKFSAAEFL